MGNRQKWVARDAGEGTPVTRRQLLTLTGQGRKTRVVPLMTPTATVVDQYLRAAGLVDPTHGPYPLFPTRFGTHLTRMGMTVIVKKYVDAPAYVAGSSTRRIRWNVPREPRLSELSLSFRVGTRLRTTGAAETPVPRRVSRCAGKHPGLS